MLSEQNSYRERKLSDAELAKALSLVSRDPEVGKILEQLLENSKAVRLGRAKRDRDLEDRLGVGVYQLVDSVFPRAALRDGFEISRRLVNDVTRRAELNSLR